MFQKAPAVPPPPPATIPATKAPPPPPPSAANPPQSVNLSVHPTRSSVPGSVTASKYTATNGGASSTVNVAVGVHFAHHSRQEI
jgi:hypothetical protein